MTNEKIKNLLKGAKERQKIEKKNRGETKRSFSCEDKVQ